MSQDQSRSTDSKDFQQLPHHFAVMVKHFVSQSVINEHIHQRHQLLYATEGLMQLYTNNEIWLVPNDRAIFIPANMEHSLKMLSDVTMHSLYIDTKSNIHDSEQLKVIAVSRLMRELITALGTEEVNYQANSRADKIAQLIELELKLAKNTALIIPLPKDTRLQQLCAYLIDNPSDNKTLCGWADSCGASERTLSRLFDKELGMSFRHWRQLVRFHYAIELLTKKQSIKSVATQCGYRSPSAFTAAFKLYVGYAPSALNGYPQQPPK